MLALVKKISLSSWLAKSGLDQLDARQKKLLWWICILAGIFFTYQLGVKTYLDSRKQLLNQVQRKSENLKKINGLRQEYLAVKKQEGGLREVLAKRSSDFALFSFIDKQVEETKVKDKVKYMKPTEVEAVGDLQESSIELKLQDVTLEHFVLLLQRLESDENSVFLRRLSIQENSKDETLFEIIMQISTFIKK